MVNEKLGILLPVRIDSAERLENIYCTVNFLFQHGFRNISVIEGTPICNGFVEALLAKRINYTFMKDEDPVFHRTRYINQMVAEATTEFTADFDTLTNLFKQLIA